MVKAWLLALFLIVVTVVPTAKYDTIITPNEWLIQCCIAYRVELDFALAVAEVESSGHGLKFRYGYFGKGKHKVAGPFGINICYASRYNIHDVYTNIWLGVRALRGGWAILPIYNAECDTSYIQAVRAAYQRNKKIK